MQAPSSAAVALALGLMASSRAAETQPRAWLPVYHLAQSGTAEPATEADPLDTPVASFRAFQIPIASAFLSLSRVCGATFVLDPAVKGDVTLEMRGGTARDLADALAKSQGCYWERDGRVIAIRKNVLRFYEIDYPQMTRSAQGSSNVVLSAQSGSYPGATPGATGIPISSAAAGAPSSPYGSYPNQNDQTNLSIQQQNQTTFWSDIQTELTAVAGPGESVSVNKLAGLAIVTAPPARQEDFKALISMINLRISRQVRISARVLEVELSSQNQLGVDWSLAATTAGGLTLGGIGTQTGFTTINGESLIPSTVSGTISAGKVSAMISALKEQGEVRAVSNPSVISLSNQTAFVKVGTEQTFFSLSNATTIAQTASIAPSTTTQNTYTQNAITIGTVLYVTPEVNSDGTVTVDVLPAITQLIGVDTSPDGQQTAPRMDIKALSTIARLSPGESVMIGGLIYNESSKQSQSVPGLGDLPLVGKLFATSGRLTDRSELVIFLTAEPVK